MLGTEMEQGAPLLAVRPAQIYFLSVVRALSTDRNRNVSALVFTLNEKCKRSSGLLAKFNQLIN
jgi:hypothetical protein